MTPELESRYEALLQGDLSWAACAAAGLPETHLAIMRHERYKQLLRTLPYAPEPGSFEWTVRNRLSSNAQSARKTVARNPALVAHYTKRQILRDAGQNPDTLPVPHLRRGPAPQAEPVVERPLDEWERLELLAARPLHNVAGHRYGERGPDVRYERQQLHNENYETRQARQALAARRRALEAKARLDRGVTKKSPERQAERREERLRARGELARMETWSEQAMADLLAIEAQGRTVPVARRHLHAAVPLHLRPRFRHAR